MINNRVQKNIDISMFQEINQICPGGVERHVDLATISSWKIGGNADLVISPSCVEEVSRLRRWFAERGMHTIVVGMSSNLLFADEGVRVPIIRIGHRMAKITRLDRMVYAEAGVWVPGFARFLMLSDLSGAEHICGIPGTLGGLICMNGGSQRKDIAKNIVRIESVTNKGKIYIRNMEDCEFSYRKSMFQSADEIITAAWFEFEPSNSADVRSKMLNILSDRRRKFPRKIPNCGSVFKSDPTMYAQIGPPGSAIEKMGLKGLRCGDAEVSEQHANFILNLGKASANDILNLISMVRNIVADNTGYSMEAEVRYVTSLGEIIPASKAQEYCA